MNMISKGRLARIRKAVRGHQEEIATKCKVNPQTVSRVLNGYWHNEKIILTADAVRQRLSQEKKTKLQKFLQRLKSN